MVKSARRAGLLVTVSALACAFGLQQFQSAVAAPAVAPDFSANVHANFAASQVGQRLMTQLAQVSGYAGLQVVSGGVEVDTAGASAAAAASVIAKTNRTFGDVAVPVVVRHVANSQADLQQLASQLDKDRATWSAQGVELTAWGVDVPSNSVRVMLAKYSTQYRDLLLAQYGNRVTVDPQDDQVAGSSDRFHDTPAWWGGDYIDVAGSGCTSWFSLHSTGNNLDYNATAGHCSPVGGNVYNSTDPETTPNQQGDVTSGHVHWSTGGNVDVEIYTVTSNAAEVWADPTTPSRLVTSRSTGDPVGTLLCTDGATNREVCSVKILNSSMSVTYNGKTVNQQVYCHQINGVAAFSSGDSGGPVYAGKDGSAEAQAFGMIVAAPADPSYGWYTPARSIFAAYSALTFKPAV